MSRPILLVVTAIVALLAFAGGAYLFERVSPDRIASVATSEENILVQPYSPVLGPKNAPVTIVEFFDPACEACRAIYPAVKAIMRTFPEDVRVVLRYTTFHKGSDEAVRILETARLQGVFEPVLEALLKAQPDWAAHGAPNLEKAWAAAEAAGLDLARAKREMLMPDITGIINQDMADVRAAGVKQTPTFFVNRKPLPSFGARQLQELVQSEVRAARDNN